MRVKGVLALAVLWPVLCFGFMLGWIMMVVAERKEKTKP